ncbi:unnamed protein product [Heterobilharzia americana]|nr:unnamed protein product [Heterobilharzia americana]CAH8291717.1 unnamed protein product [Heterobilharzia americana]
MGRCKNALNRLWKALEPQLFGESIAYLRIGNKLSHLAEHLRSFTNAQLKISKKFLHLSLVNQRYKFDEDLLQTVIKV